MGVPLQGRGGGWGTQRGEVKNRDEGKGGLDMGGRGGGGDTMMINKSERTANVQN